MEEDEEYIEEDEIDSEEETEGNLDLSSFSHYVGAKFNKGLRTYFFGVNNIDLKNGDKIVVETNKGIELVNVVTDLIDINEYNRNLALKPVLRKATATDIKNEEANEADAEEALGICATEIKRLGLDMRLIDCEYTLDRAKVTFSYVADERVDFRELLRVLASHFHTRIELRQVGARDKAKTVGGLGVCGLPLCCSMFLNEFDGISINRAKNQMLTINIPKLSGQCNKLMCCLKYEDDAYSELKEVFPDIGQTLWIDHDQFTVSSINVISGVVELRGEDNIQTIPLSRYDEIVSENRKRKNKNEES
ncbi:MAG: stage 0 sporulation protein [Coprobacillus sp.]|nr:stage 0 sporulation protein [Coprobacillus sp.]